MGFAVVGAVCSQGRGGRLWSGVKAKALVVWAGGYPAHLGVNWQG